MVEEKERKRKSGEKKWEREGEGEGERERDRCRLRSFVHAPIRALEVGTNVAGRVSRRRGQILHPRINIGGHGCTGRAAPSDVNAHFSSRLHGCLWDGTQPSSHRRHSSCGLFLLFPCARAIVKFVSWPRTSRPARCPVASLLLLLLLLLLASSALFPSSPLVFFLFVPLACSVCFDRGGKYRERERERERETFSRESLECIRMDENQKGVDLFSS